MLRCSVQYCSYRLLLDGLYSTLITMQIHQYRTCIHCILGLAYWLSLFSFFKYVVSPFLKMHVHVITMNGNSFQWLGGLFSFLIPMISMPMREKMMPYHVFFGISGYVLAIAAALLGLAEKASFRLYEQKLTNIFCLRFYDLLFSIINLQWIRSFKITKRSCSHQFYGTIIRHLWLHGHSFGFL